MADTVYIIDSHSHLYASFFAIRNLTAPSGEPTGATLGFTNAVLKILRDKKPTYLGAVFDAPAELLRKKAFADYKITRRPMPEELPPQIFRVKQILQLLGVKIVECPGYEADDIIAKFALEARRDGCEVVIVSRDKDLMQLLGPGVVMYDNRNNTIIDENWLKEEKGLTPGQVVDMLALMGDASDNIPGVPGIGEKRAVALLQKYGSLDEVLAHADEVPGKMGESLRGSVELARLSQELATLQPNVPVDVTYLDLAPGTEDVPQLAKVFRELAFKSLAEQYEKKAGLAGSSPAVGSSSAAPASAAADAEDVGGAGAAATSEPSAYSSASQSAASPSAPESAGVADSLFAGPTRQDFRCVANRKELKELAARLESAKAFAFDTELTGIDTLTSKLVGLSVCLGQGEAYYIPILAPEPDKCLDLDLVRRTLQPALADAHITKVGHNIKFDISALRTAGFEVDGPIFDTMIASYLLEPEGRRHSLDSLAQELLHYTGLPITDLIGKKGRGHEQKTMDQVPLGLITFYCAEDSELTWRLYLRFDTELRERGLDKLFYEVEMPLVRVLEQMERNGVALDRPLLAGLSKTFGERLAELEKEIYRLAGHEFNIDSPKQLGTILFDELGLKSVKKTKGGGERSTDSQTLEVLAKEHQLAARVLDYRSLAKLKSTYIDALPLMVNPQTGRVHASFNQAVTATGRLSSSDPNLQNIPIREELGRDIRAAFVTSDPGHDVLLTADYSQIELRLLAHFSRDPYLVDAFNRDLDIHAVVAGDLFGVPVEQVTSEQRYRAKTVNFSLIYGKSAYGLAEDLGISRGEAASFIEQYFARYTRVKEFMVSVLQGAQRDGYVTTILGRRRATPGIRHTDARNWNNPERAAFNTVLQGSAADMIKVAMNNIYRRIREEKRPAKMVLQVHDELVFEVPAGSVEAEREMVVHEMSVAIKLDVPMKVGVAWGPNWREAK